MIFKTFGKRALAVPDLGFGGFYLVFETFVT